ncbi:hypothetical protein LTR37_006278 [Vermiconidia calcicola]|uniref:Uncharacterized protein n=1 Tax=Vermiconidia calcicola TaxID=1690605 RepID=A0ACC3NH34_9PEZI|nr:hypothetical protein LTR37_006278 [Vermiconidia calcicola]
MSGDVEMKEELPVDASLSEIQQAPDPTDPQPPPQTQPSAPMTANTEHLSTIQPAAPTAAATPPVLSQPATRPGSMPPQPPARPEKPVAHGGPTRQYLNQNVTPHLLEGMKYLAAYEPEKPLQWLSDFLRDRSKEVEG